jgi:hypothetical protein
MSSDAGLEEAMDPAGARAQAIATFRNGARTSSTWAAFIVVAALVALSFRSSAGSSIGLVALIAVTWFLHDLGCWVGIRLLGYPDPELLLLPFFRKALPPEGERVEQWRRGVILLLGPLPCIFVAFVLALAPGFAAVPELRHGIVVITIVSSVGLIPFSSFDGGRILNLVVFSRSRWIELAFSLLTGAALGLGALLWSSWLLGVLAVFALLGARARFRITGAIADMRARFPDLLRKPVKVPEPAVDALFTAADELVTSGARAMMQKSDLRSAPIYAGLMRQIHDGAVQEPPSLLASFLLLLAYVGGIGLAAITLVLATLAASGGPL